MRDKSISSSEFPMQGNVCKICEREIVFVYFLGRFLVLIFLEPTTLTKPVNNQTDCRIALEKIEEIMDLSYNHLAVLQNNLYEN